MENKGKKNKVTKFRNLEASVDVSTKLTLCDFFGINLRKSPNSDWSIVGESHNRMYKFTDIDADKYVFNSCIASITDDGTTDFYFIKDFNYDDAFKVVFMLEKAFGKNKIKSFAECVSKYVSIIQLHGSNGAIVWNKSGCKIVYMYMQDSDTINVLVNTPFYYSDFLDQKEVASSDVIVTTRGFTIPTVMKKFNVIVEVDMMSLQFFANEYWMDNNQPEFMASMLIDGDLYAFNVDTHEFYFKYSCPEIEKKFKEGYNAIIAVTNYELRDKDIVIELYAQFVKSEDSVSSGELVRQYGTTYELSYMDDQGHFQNKVIKNANMNTFIAGIKYRTNYKEILAQLYVGMKVQLRREPDNAFDADAIAVFNGECHLGYIPKKDIPAILLNMKEECLPAEIYDVDEERVGLIVPVTFYKLEEVSDEEFGHFTFFKTERTKYENKYQESRSPISKEEFLEGIKQQIADL